MQCRRNFRNCFGERCGKVAMYRENMGFCYKKQVRGEASLEEHGT